MTERNDADFDVPKNWREDIFAYLDELSTEELIQIDALLTTTHIQ